jgi:hypothetical protein
MQLQEIREIIIHQLQYDIENWNEVLSNTNPGNYGINDWEAEIDEAKLYVDIPKKEFNFKNSRFSANLIMGASKGDTRFDMPYNKSVSGKGTFEINDNKEIKIIEVEIEIDNEVFND